MDFTKILACLDKYCMARVSIVQTTASCKLGQTICLLLRKFSKVRAARRRSGPARGPRRAMLISSRDSHDQLCPLVQRIDPAEENPKKTRM